MDDVAGLWIKGTWISWLLSSSSYLRFSSRFDFSVYSPAIKLQMVPKHRPERWTRVNPLQTFWPRKPSSSVRLHVKVRLGKWVPSEGAGLWWYVRLLSLVVTESWIDPDFTCFPAESLFPGRSPCFLVDVPLHSWSYFLGVILVYPKMRWTVLEDWSTVRKCSFFFFLFYGWEPPPLFFWSKLSVYLCFEFIHVLYSYITTWCSITQQSV